MTKGLIMSATQAGVLMTRTLIMKGLIATMGCLGRLLVVDFAKYRGRWILDFKVKSRPPNFVLVLIYSVTHWFARLALALPSIHLEF